ncbi:MAG: methyltransferase domain-containing protein [Deltaproteobacteria bacterium]|nr:methyltransferase domain-containing protein [Deltaproteobacteria bacterium]MBW2137886.1 methyltransferase domain-containing protein [Deltaproteobacteria bacterium]
MEVDLIERLNILWRPIYPYLAQWICQWWEKKEGWMLEIGPFSGGISDAMVNLLEGVRAVCLVPEREVIEGIRNEFNRQIDYLEGAMDRLPFREASLDMVLSRGAFFFLSPEILRETSRVLKAGAVALLGGGYGPHTPEEEIRRIGEESKELNYRLGKRWMGRRELEGVVGSARLGCYWVIIEEGGLWLLLRRN